MDGKRLRVSKNRRYFELEDGTPFFYLADTAWRIFYTGSLEDARTYLEDRAAKGFTVIQSILMFEYNENNDCRAYPVFHKFPEEPNEEYFHFVDAVMDMAEELGLYMAVSPTWGDFVVPNPWYAEMAAKHPAIFDAANAYIYGKFLGSRFKDRRLIWILGGDRPADHVEDIWRSMALGLKEGDGGTHLMTFHTSYDAERQPIPSSSAWFHHDQWLDFNMLQSGHWWDTKNYEFVRHDYELTPVKPVLDGESKYENIADRLLNPEKRLDAFKIREAAYGCMLAGAAGHTYGDNDVWQFHDHTGKKYCFANTHWRAVLDAPGAVSMTHLKKLFQLRPWYKLRPDQSVITPSAVGHSGDVRAAMEGDGHFAIVYLPAGGSVSVHLNMLTGQTVTAHWYDPRTGATAFAGQYPAGEAGVFTAPTSGYACDWVLVLDGETQSNRALG